MNKRARNVYKTDIFHNCGVDGVTAPRVVSVTFLVRGACLNCVRAQLLTSGGGGLETDREKEEVRDSV